MRGEPSSPWCIKIVMSYLRIILWDETQTVGNSPLHSSSPTLDLNNRINPTHSIIKILYVIHAFLYIFLITKFSMALYAYSREYYQLTSVHSELLLQAYLFISDQKQPPPPSDLGYLILLCELDLTLCVFCSKPTVYILNFD